VYPYFKNLIAKGMLVLATLTTSEVMVSAQAGGLTKQAQGNGIPPLSDHRLQDAVFLGQDDLYKESGQQLSGSVSGTVLDRTGAVAVGANVRLTRKDQPLSPQEIVSGNNGQFSFSHVSPGPFQLTVTAKGFATQVFSGDLRPGQTYLVPPIVLTVATAVTKVQVGLTQVEVAQIQIKEQEKQRVLGFIPNFLVTYVPNAAPLNSRQKFRLATKVAIDPVTFAATGVYAGLEQAGNRYPEFGQGALGYAKRYGTAYTSALAAIYIGNAVMPSLLKQDPRYFYKGTGSVGSRILYAAASSVICKGDNGRWQPNYSFISGSIAVGGISTLYYPISGSTAAFVFQNALIRLGQGSLGGILQEFVLKKLTPHLRRQASTQP